MRKLKGKLFPDTRKPFYRLICQYNYLCNNGWKKSPVPEN